jgi:TPP-dependent 2-oxoacid decarboxylase
MKVEEWLSNLKYESHGMTIEKIVNGSSVVVIDIRGWSTIVKSLGSENRAAVFQDSVGEFILEAINEKLENDKTKQKIWEVIKEGITQEAVDELNSIPRDILKETAKKYLKNDTNN